MRRSLQRGLLAGLLAIGAVMAYLGALWLLGPVMSVATGASAPAPVVVEITDGMTLRHLAAKLERDRLIRSELAFVLLAKFTGADRHLKAGEYALHAGMRPRDILNEFLSGRGVLHQITIPEGYTIVEMAQVVAQKSLADPEEFIRLTRDKAFIRSLEIEAASLEGYLFPNTYKFARRTKPKDILKEMVAGLRTVVTPELAQRTQEIHMSLHQVLTLASIVEKEAGLESERPLIASVFHNRLERGIPLQSDPTVIYGLEHFDGNIRKQDLDSPSPYNTYRVRGLPPGPIANPGLGSIKAVLYPASTTNLYFVSRNDGTHQFSATLAEHNRAVEKYQRRRGVTSTKRSA
ncbi:MAG: endolytic transglycosylase MltG [Nitrospira sp.]|nr:endolytic transglycosylase MltG [Nitrospira sp.]